MTKKEYVLKVLEKSQGYREQAKTMLEYLRANDDDLYVEYLYGKCIEAVNNALQSSDQERIKGVSVVLDQLREKEKMPKKADEEDVKRLDQLLASM